MALNGNGVRDTARVVRISPTTVIAILKKTAALQHSNLALAFPRSRVGAARVRPPGAAELDEMWSFVGAKESARCLWHALDVLSQSLCTILYGEKFEREKYYSL